MEIDRSFDNLKGETTRSKLLWVIIFLDVSFFVLMAVGGAGPLGNRSLYWSKYTSADLPAFPGQQNVQLLTGMWGTCRQTPNLLACYQWWYDPVWPYLYSNSLFYAIATMQVLAGCILFFGVIGLAFLTLGPLLVASLVATLLYIPAYSMMQWLSTNIGTKFGYDGWSYGPSMGCATAALAVCILSLFLKLMALKAPHTSREDVERKQEVQPVYAAPVAYSAPVAYAVPVEPQGVPVSAQNVPVVAQEAKI